RRERCRRGESSKKRHPHTVIACVLVHEHPHSFALSQSRQRFGNSLMTVEQSHSTFTSPIGNQPVEMRISQWLVQGRKFYLWNSGDNARENFPIPIMKHHRDHTSFFG